uniref:Uncharacterized protein n=1 Tax=Strombidium inclinatum TaxID=197538 RepID=A0A7S3IPU6_9SPIT|mmetsp:Transcript_32883/g.50279  ORF Transcript_32883/g.50279 Transcript_32883/m.50279 type:complete len:281 (+) Transcript_32883:178-1020(+)
MEKELQEERKQGESIALKKKTTYSKAGLLPDSILSLICYKNLYEALKSEDQDAIFACLSSFTRVSAMSCFRKFERIDQKREKKNLLRAHIYLEALLTLNKMPSQIQKPMEVLLEKSFRGLNQQALTAILEKFTDVQDPNAEDDKKQKRRRTPATPEGTEFQPEVKYVKTKEHQRMIMCHIVGVAIHLAQNNQIWGSVLARTLKKDVGDLKQYFKELNFHMEVKKNPKSASSDILVSLHGSMRRREIKAAAKTEEKAITEEEDTKEDSKVGSKRSRAKSAD